MIRWVMVMTSKKQKLNKEEYSKVFNALLGTNIDWTKLGKEDLIQLAVVFNNPEIILNRLGIRLDNKQMVRTKVVDTILKALKESGFKGPVVSILDDLFGTKKE